MTSEHTPASKMSIRFSKGGTYDMSQKNSKPCNTIAALRFYNQV